MQDTQEEHNEDNGGDNRYAREQCSHNNTQSAILCLYIV